MAAFHSPVLGKRIRVEHEDNANSMGRSAGRNMAGMNEPYNHLPSFYSDMFELGYEAVGEVDSRLETFADWKRPNEERCRLLSKERPRAGCSVVECVGQVQAARELIAESGPFTPKDLEKLLPVRSKA